jgi:hypothetical protein
MFGLSLVQLLVVAVGVTAGTLLMVTVSVPAGLAVMVTLGAFGAVKVHGMSVVELAPQGVRFLMASRTGNAAWLVVVPVLGGDARSAPRALAGLDLLIVDAGQVGVGAPGAKIAVSRDRRAGTVAATLRVSGRQFGLIERAEQDWMVSQWGTALQAFVNERTAVVSVRWSEWAAPAGLDEHRAWLAEHLAANPLDDVRDAYERLLQEAGSHATRHEVLVTVAVHCGKVRASKRDGRDRLGPAVKALLGEVKLFAERLEGANLSVSAPLSPAEWARVMRLRLDPSCRLSLDGRVRSLGETAGACSLGNAVPLAAETTWAGWRTDGSWHRALYVADWPRLDVAAAWMADLMLYAGSVRTIAVFFEPIARSKSQRSIVRDAAKIESDAAHRTEKGFRVGAHHRRAARAVEEREEELVAGYGEFSYAGVVTITSPSLDELDAATAEITQVGASVGLELRPLHGRHDFAVAATLPIARGLVPKEWL